ncbi:MAG TPA: DUF1847 domain-containing protein, partial [Thermodesulfobacteriota bacterium]|nr:DUF1847 domain-containing protein [Thermodesulfobacteriota bacterium]
MRCSTCDEKDCYTGKDCTRIKELVVDRYSEVSNQKLMKTASGIEACHYMKLTRVEELITFAQGMGFGRLGIAFCIGLEEEARVLGKILEQSFHVSSVCCKVCGID